LPNSTARDREPLHGFEKFADKVLRDWKVPGAAITVVHGGEVVFSRGIGHRDAESALPVTEHTLFPQASVTKAFTTMSIGILADEGLLDWDTPVREYLPDFRLWDSSASERITPRDLVTHRSGLPRHDISWYGSDRTREELVAGLRHLEPTRDLRSFWQYQNLMYMAAGYLAGQVVGSSWEEVVRMRIFEPLGMVSSNFAIGATQQTSDFSLPYMRRKGGAIRIPFYAQQDAIGPAGAIISNVVDMSRWLMLHLNGGTIGDRRVVSPAQIAQMHTAQMVSSKQSRWPELAQQSYALGWFVQPYRGRPMLHHGGNIDGFSTLCSFLPDHDVGVIVLTNMDTSPAPSILTWNVFDRILGMGQLPWSDRYLEEFREAVQAETRGKDRRRSRKIARTRPSHSLDEYTGAYTHPGYDAIHVDLKGNRLVGQYHGMELPLKHYHYDTFETTIEVVELTMKVQFVADVHGDIVRLVAPLEPTGHDIVFERVPAASLTERSFLEQFAGAYDYRGRTLTVTVKAGGLRISVPEQPEYEVTPIKDLEFGAKGMSGLSVRFTLNEKGAAAEVEVEQAESVFVAKRKMG